MKSLLGAVYFGLVRMCFALPLECSEVPLTPFILILLEEEGEFEDRRKCEV